VVMTATPVRDGGTLGSGGALEYLSKPLLIDELLALCES